MPFEDHWDLVRRGNPHLADDVFARYLAEAAWDAACATERDIQPAAGFTALLSELKAFVAWYEEQTGDEDGSGLIKARLAIKAAEQGSAATPQSASTAHEAGHHLDTAGNPILDENGNPIPSSACICAAWSAAECCCGAWDT